MLVDTERVLLELKRFIATKPHHGQRELALVIAELEAEHMVEEGLPERALRLYGLEFFEEAVREGRAPSSQGDCVPAAEGDQDRALRGDSSPSPEEDTHAHRGTRAGHGRRRFVASRGDAASGVGASAGSSRAAAVAGSR